MTMEITEPGKWEALILPHRDTLRHILIKDWSVRCSQMLILAYYLKDMMTIYIEGIRPKTPQS